MAGETLWWPMRFTVVIIRDRRNARRKLNPGLLGRSKDVYIRWQVIWRVKGADANKPDDRARTGVVAPYCHPAFWAARDLLPLAAVGRRIDDFRVGTQIHHVICLDHGIQCERCAALSLAPTTMAAVYEQRRLDHTIADDAAIAAAVERKGISRNHARTVYPGPMPAL